MKKIFLMGWISLHFLSLPVLAWNDEERAPLSECQENTVKDWTAEIVRQLNKEIPAATKNAMRHQVRRFKDNIKIDIETNVEMNKKLQKEKLTQQNIPQLSRDVEKLLMKLGYIDGSQTLQFLKCPGGSTQIVSFKEEKKFFPEGEVIQYTKDACKNDAFPLSMLTVGDVSRNASGKDIDIWFYNIVSFKPGEGISINFSGELLEILTILQTATYEVLAGKFYFNPLDVLTVSEIVHQGKKHNLEDFLIVQASMHCRKK